MGIESILQSHMQKFGYQHVDTPIVEPARLYLTKAGDQVLDRLFVVMHSGQEFVLRPEFTASAADKFIREIKQGAVRWQFSGPIFQDIPGDSSRQFQRQSIGAEFIGVDSRYADAEIIAVAMLGLDEIGVGGSKVSIGHVGLTRHLLQQFNLDKRSLRFLLSKRALLRARDGQEVVTRALDDFLQHTPTVHENSLHISEVETKTSTEQMLNALLNSSEYGATLGGRTRGEIAHRLLEKQTMVAQRDQIIEAIAFLSQWVSISNAPDKAFKQIESFTKDEEALRLLDGWRETIEFLQSFGVDVSHITITPDLARTWDYYTGVVFEIEVDTGGDNLIHIGGGGRYDELSRLIGANQDTPAVGFSYDVDGLAQITKDGKDEVLITLGVNQDYKSAIWWSQQLRREGFSVRILQDDQVNVDVLIMTRDSGLQYSGQNYTEDDLRQLVQDLRNR